MHVTLIEPSTVFPNREATGVNCEAPMALTTLGSSLKSAGHDVEIIDSIIEGYDQHVPIRSDLVSVGLTPNQVARRIDARTDCIGISCNFFFNFPTCLALGKHLRQQFPTTTVIMGGVGATAFYDMILQQGGADFIVLREGDDVLPALLRSLRNPERVPGIAWLASSGEVRVNDPAPLPSPLDNYPFPDRTLVDLRRYHEIGRPFGFVKEKRFGTTLLTSRGCPMHCSFCTAALVHGRKFRSRSASNVLSEIQYLVEKFGIEELRIIDETFTLDKSRTNEILDGIINRRYNKSLSWTCPNGLFIESLDEKTIDKMQESNCHSVALAVESGNPFVSKNIVNKTIDHEKAEKIIKHFTENTDIMVCVYYIIGFPGETKTDILDTLNFANRMKTHNATISILMPYPRTAVFETARAAGQLLLDENDPDFFYKLLPKHGLISTDEFTPNWLSMIQEVDRFLALHRKGRRSLLQLTRDLVERNGWRAPWIAAMVAYHALADDLSGRRTCVQGRLS